MSGNIEKMQAEIESLKWQVAELNAIIGKQTVDNRGVVLKSPQQRRDEIVEQAKRDVESLKNEYQLSEKEVAFSMYKREVRAYITHLFSGKELTRGIAKCAPNDCFNVHIGKAIALRRALGLEVPAEYLNAPQPTEVRVGDVVTFPGGINKRVLYRVDDTEKKEDNLTIVRCDVAPSLVGKKANADFTNRDSMLPVVDDSRE